MNNHAEVEVEIERLCRDICHPDGRMYLRRLNPNPNLVYIVGVDSNSPTDDMFLRSFVKHSAFSLPATYGPRRETGSTLGACLDHLAAIGAELVSV